MFYWEYFLWHWQLAWHHGCEGIRSELPALSAKSTSISSPKACARIHRPRFLLIVSSFTRCSFVSCFKQQMTTEKVCRFRFWTTINVRTVTREHRRKFNPVLFKRPLDTSSVTDLHFCSHSDFLHSYQWLSIAIRFFIKTYFYLWLQSLVMLDIKIFSYQKTRKTASVENIHFKASKRVRNQY